jgi:hypothetical protein
MGSIIYTLVTVHDKYMGHDRVHTADGNGMKIEHIGHSILRTSHSSLKLNNILHVPSARKNLISVHKLTLHNGAFIEFWPYFLLIKDQDTRRTLFKGP